jgi:Ca-activated chloride channel family protein
LEFEKQAALDFLSSTLRRGRDKAAVFTFNSYVTLRQDYTGDLPLSSDALTQIHSGGGTGLYDALHFVVQGTLARQKGRRGIILLSDGDDNASRIPPQEVVDAAQRNNVSIYAISVNSLGAEFVDSVRVDRVLQMFAVETGGNAFFPSRVKQLSAYFNEISNELRTQYAIGYRSTNPKRDGSFRNIRITVKNAHYSVRSRSGYYAPLEASVAQR